MGGIMDLDDYCDDAEENDEFFEIFIEGGL